MREQQLKEQKAQQLWARYATSNENNFWQAYDALLEPKKAAAQTKVNQDLAIKDKKSAVFQATPPAPKLSTQVYKTSFWRSIYSVIIANVLVGWMLWTLTFKHIDPRVQGLLLIGLIAPWLDFAWNYHTFTLSAQGLQVSKVGIPYYDIAWGEITRVEYTETKGNYYLKVTTHQVTYSFKADMSGSKRDELKTAIEQRVKNLIPSRI